MPQIRFTPHLRAWVPLGPHTVEATRLDAALEAVFSQHSQVRSYLLDDQGRLRRHVSVFVDGQRVHDLQCTLRANAQIYVLQALSGG